MKKNLKNYVIKLIQKFVYGLSKIPVGRYLLQQFIDAAMMQKSAVTHRGLNMVFSAPNRLNDYRVSTFSTKEPETLDWVDTIPEGSVLWDVGANVGLYSVYAAKARKCQVFAYEPSVFNLELLARNIFQNGLQDRITIIPTALSDSMGGKLFKMSSTAWGGALSTFGESFDQNGQTLDAIFEYRTFGISMEDAVILLHIPTPKYLKIDVDGIEHLILRGGIKVLSTVESVLIEINDNFPEQSEQTTSILQNAGLTLYRKCDLGVESQFNQWWVRPGAVN